MKKKAVHKSTFLHRISSHRKIDDLSFIFREFLKQNYHLAHEFTFVELKEKIAHKIIPPEVKAEIEQLCQSFEAMEYRQKKPSSKEIRLLKKLLKDAVRKGMTEKKTEHHSVMDVLKVTKRKIGKIKKKESEHIKEIQQKLEKKKEKISKSLISRIKKSLHLDEDKEMREIDRFIKASIKVGVKKKTILKELRQMGFHSKKISAAMKKS